MKGQQTPMASPEPLKAAERNTEPVVPLPRSSNLGMYAFFGVLTIGGIAIFSSMNANRMEATAPQTTALGPPSGRIASAQPPTIPARFGEPLPVARRSLQPALASPLPAPVVVRQVQPGSRPADPAPQQALQPQATQPARGIQRPSVVFDETFDSLPPGQSQSPLAAGSADRVTATRLGNPSLTVPRGTVIPAVLETALDSTRPGNVRALIQRDVYAFDGTRVLIPRGSRLYGAYEADLASGQKRAAIQWTRLLRPDGVIIALDSPASDPLGRAGVEGKVDSKFFRRFGGAILQSVLDIGVGVATREATDGVIVALPGSTQNVQVSEPESIRPTLKVRHGTSVSVFVARDLDFSTVDR